MVFDLGELWNRLSKAQSENIKIKGEDLGQVFLLTLAFVAVLFLIIQFVALAIGFVLARQITGAVHDLFTGTQHVRGGNFGHQIPVRARDQLAHRLGIGPHRLDPHLRTT